MATADAWVNWRRVQGYINLMDTLKAMDPSRGIGSNADFIRAHPTGCRDDEIDDADGAERRRRNTLAYQAARARLEA